MLHGTVLYQKALLSGKIYLEVLSREEGRVKVIAFVRQKELRQFEGRLLTFEYKRKSPSSVNLVNILGVCEQHSLLPLLNSPLALTVWRSALDLCRLLPSGEVCEDLEKHLEGVREALLGGVSQGTLWRSAYLSLEMCVLRALGFGMHINACKVTQETEGLAFISPRTGAAVVERVGLPYKSKLLRYPSAFTHMRSDSQCSLTDCDFLEALHVIGFFINKYSCRALARDQILLWLQS